MTGDELRERVAKAIYEENVHGIPWDKGKDSTVDYARDQWHDAWDEAPPVLRTICEALGITRDALDEIQSCVDQAPFHPRDEANMVGALRALLDGAGIE